MARWAAFLVGAAFALSAGARAQAPASPHLRVIDAGPAIPVSPYVSYLIAGTDQRGVLEGVHFPLVSSLPAARLMTAGTQVLDARWVTNPLFLVGADAASERWLQANAEALAALGAVGLVLAAPDEAAFKRLQALAEAHALALAPGPDHWLEALLLAKGAGVLPLLIGFDGRAQQEVPGS